MVDIPSWPHARPLPSSQPIYRSLGLLLKLAAYFLVFELAIGLAIAVFLYVRPYLNVALIGGIFCLLSVGSIQFKAHLHREGYLKDWRFHWAFWMMVALFGTFSIFPWTIPTFP